MEIYLATKQSSDDEPSERTPKKRKRDPNAPKHSISAYMIFYRDVRSSVKEEFPEATFAEISKHIGARWKNMSEEEKQVRSECSLSHRNSMTLPHKIKNVIYGSWKFTILRKERNLLLHPLKIPPLFILLLNPIPVLIPTREVMDQLNQVQRKVNRATTNEMYVNKIDAIPKGMIQTQDLWAPWD